MLVVGKVFMVILRTPHNKKVTVWVVTYIYFVVDRGRREWGGGAPYFYEGFLRPSGVGAIKCVIQGVRGMGARRCCPFYCGS